MLCRLVPQGGVLPVYARAIWTILVRVLPVLLAIGQLRSKDLHVSPWLDAESQYTLASYHSRALDFSSRPPLLSSHAKAERALPAFLHQG